MKKIKQLALGLVIALGLAAGAHAEGGGIAWDKAPSRTNDLPALQNGAKLFVNYCLNCHSAAYMRYNRMKDIGLTDEQIKQNLLFANDKVGDTMKVTFDPKQAKEWLAAAPPDLSVITRSRADIGNRPRLGSVPGRCKVDEGDRAMNRAWIPAGALASVSVAGLIALGPLTDSLGTTPFIPRSVQVNTSASTVRESVPVSVNVGSEPNVLSGNRMPYFSAPKSGVAW